MERVFFAVLLSRRYPGTMSSKIPGKRKLSTQTIFIASVAIFALAACAESAQEEAPPAAIVEEETPDSEYLDEAGEEDQWVSPSKADSWVTQTESGKYQINYVPEGFDEVIQGVAIRALDGRPGVYEVTPYRDCTVKVNAVFYDDSNRVVDEVFDSADVPFGYIGVIELRSTSRQAVGHKVTEAACYFSSNISLDDLLSLGDIEVNAFSDGKSSTSSAPWAPEGYWEASGNLAFRWAASSGDPCNDPCLFWRAEVVTKNGCPGGVYAEVDFIKSGSVVSQASSSVRSLPPGEVGKLAFIVYGHGSTTTGNETVDLTNLSCR